MRKSVILLLYAFRRNAAEIRNLLVVHFGTNCFVIVFACPRNDSRKVFERAALTPSVIISAFHKEYVKVRILYIIRRPLFHCALMANLNALFALFVNGVLVCFLEVCFKLIQPLVFKPCIIRPDINLRFCIIVSLVRLCAVAAAARTRLTAPDKRNCRR